MQTHEFSIETRRRLAIDLTDHIRSFCSGKGDGLCHVFAPHATAGLALMETGSGSEGDLGELVERLLPRDDRYRHAHGSPGHGGDHLLPALVPPVLVLAVEGGRLVLGTWQSVVLVDPNRDNPVRTIQLRFLADTAADG